MWFKRKAKKISTIEIRHTVPTVTHLIAYAPKPKPTTMQGRIRNEVGHEWSLMPQIITGQTTMPVSFPVAFLTGRDEDSAKQATIMFYLEY